MKSPKANNSPKKQDVDVALEVEEEHNGLTKFNESTDRTSFIPNGSCCFAAITACVALVSLACFTGGWLFFIILGTTAFIVASVGAMLFEGWKKSKWLKWLLVVLIPIVLAAGGLLTTHGWNKRDSLAQDRSLLIAAAAELRLNKTYVYVKSQCRDTFLVRGGNLSTPAYVTPTAREIRQVLTQGTSFQGNRDLVHAITVYALAVDRLAPRLEYISRFCSQPIATIEMKKSAVEKELGKGNNSSLEYIAGAYEQLHAVLVSDYPWAIRVHARRTWL